MLRSQATRCVFGIGCLLAAVCAMSALQAQTATNRTSPRDAVVRPATGEGRIKLHYLQAPWKSVLQDLATAMQVTLVLPEAPKGQYSRIDWRSYSHGEALRIVNRELDAQGYRAVAKGKYLIVMKTDAMRPEYPRPTIPPDNARPTAPTAPANTNHRPRATSVTAAHQSQTWHPAGAASPARRLPPTDAHRQRSPVQPATHVRTDKLEPEAIAQVRVRIENQPANAVALRIFHACGAWARPTSGRQDPLAFRVAFSRPRNELRPRGLRTPPPSSHVRIEFSVRADPQRNEVVIGAPTRVAQSVSRLVRSFEQPAKQGKQERLLPTAGDATRIARSIRVPFNTLRARQTSSGLVEPPRSSVQAAAHQVGEAPRGGSTPIQQVIEELRGDVSVEAFEDLDALIIRGDRRDVDAVESLVRQIEQLGIGAVPEIHLLLLSHVNSATLGKLLTGVFESKQLAVDGKSEPAVSVIAVQKPNAVLIIAPVPLMPTVLELASKLDQPGDPKSSLRVFPLQNAAAAQVLQMLEDFYDSKGGLESHIHAVIDIRTNSLIVRGAPGDLNEVATLIRRIDHDQSRAVSHVRFFELRHAAAQELADVINAAIRSAITDPLSTQASGGAPSPSPRAGAEAGGARGSTRQVQAAKSVVLQYLRGSGTNRESIRSGILSDIRVTPDPRTNSLVVTAPEQSMLLMAELVKQLDRPTSMVAEVKVFTLANADAGAMVRLLQDLFTGSQQRQQQLGVQFAGAVGASSSLIPMQLSADTRTNSILATGGAESLRVVEAILLRLDQSNLRQRKNVVYRLRNSPARDVAAAISEFLESQRNISQVNPNLESTVEQVEREVIVVPELVTNSLLISSTPRYFEEIMHLTQQLDEPPPQVVIQALLVEVDLDGNDEFGVELGVQDSVLFNRSAISDIVTIAETTTSLTGVQTTTERIVSQAANPGFGFNNQPLGSNPAINTSRVGGQGLSNFSLGRVNGDLGYGGLVLSAGSESVNVLVRALAARRKINVLSRPQIRTLDNQLATIQVGQQVPIVDGVAISGTGSANPVVRQDQAGIILSVTPRISPDEVIVMEVSAEKSQFTGQGVPLFTDANTGNVIESPIKDVINAKTTVSIPNGQTIVLGGMITTLDDVSERKIPWLGDLPLLGHAFRHDAERSRRTELLIFLTPRIVHNSLESEMIKQVEAARLNYVEHHAEAVHGPLFSVPEADGMLPGYPPVLHTTDRELLPPNSLIVPQVDE